MSKTNGGKRQNAAAEFTLTVEEIERLFRAAVSKRDELILRTLYFGGLRRQELCDLDVPDVQADRGRLIVNAGKGDKSRIVMLPESLVAELVKHIGRRRVGPLFQSERGGKRLSVRSVNHILASTGERAHVTNPNPRLAHVNPHLLRHSFARHYLARGGDLRKLSQLLGHASVAITHAVYGTASEDEIQSEYRRLMGD